MLADLVRKHEHYEIVFKNIRDNLALINEDKSIEGSISIAGSSKENPFVRRVMSGFIKSLKDIKNQCKIINRNLCETL
jgi:hypothetical protein